MSGVDFNFGTRWRYEKSPDKEMGKIAQANKGRDEAFGNIAKRQHTDDKVNTVFKHYRSKSI